MRRFNYSFLFMTYLILTVSLFGQVVNYQGPATGNVSSGVMVTTDNFSDTPINFEQDKIIDRNTYNPFPDPIILNDSGVELFEHTYVEDNVQTGFGDQTVLLNKFPGIPETNSIPPDPDIAVGPNHIVATVNSRFTIWDKEGTLIKSIDADAWCSPVLPAPGAFDPQIIYDHYAGRWFMLWDNQNDATQTAYFIIFYSDDDDPLGTWYGYAIDATSNGNTTTNTWGDYPQIGFDEDAIYINSRQFGFTTGYQYNKIRILDKSELYASNGGALSWQDLWDITQPGGSNRLDVIHPSYQYSPAGGHYFLFANRGGANFYALYKITNPLTTPVLTGTNIIVPFYALAPDANQLGGGTPRISSNGSHIKSAPVFRDGYLYAAHSIRNTNFFGYTSMKYVKIDVNTNTVVESAELGADGYFYIFPTITVDKDHNVAVSYSRSADTEYCGAFYSTRQSTDPPGISESKVLQEGLGNYVKTFGGTRNRWGDYLNIFLDPVNEYNIFMITEYAAGTNQWGTYIGEIRMEPYAGIFPFTAETDLNFGNVEVGSTSQTVSVWLSNYGTNDLVISSMPDSVGDFHRISTHSFPLTLSTYDSVKVEFTFDPDIAGLAQENFMVSNNSTTFTGFTLEGFGYIILPAIGQQFYASSQQQNSGELMLINELTGAGTNIGSTNFLDITDIAIDPTNNHIWGLRPGDNGGTDILKINAVDGDGYVKYPTILPDLVSITFDTLGNCYGAVKSGQLYSIDLTDGTYTLLSTAPIEIEAIAYHPLTDEMYASVSQSTPNSDLLYKVDLSTGDTTRVGQTGFGTATLSLAFNNSGDLFGLKGAGVFNTDFISINATTGDGTVVGSTGKKSVSGLGYTKTMVTSVDDNSGSQAPKEFALNQNYPNPFNPSTSIEFSLPRNADVQINVFNILGQKVRTLLNTQKSAGTHNVIWNADDEYGNKVSSGIYFYELRATSDNGADFVQMRKMVLLK